MLARGESKFKAEARLQRKTISPFPCFRCGGTYYLKELNGVCHFCQRLTEGYIYQHICDEDRMYECCTFCANKDTKIGSVDTDFLVMGKVRPHKERMERENETNTSVDSRFDDSESDKFTMEGTIKKRE